MKWIDGEEVENEEKELSDRSNDCGWDSLVSFRGDFASDELSFRRRSSLAEVVDESDVFRAEVFEEALLPAAAGDGQDAFDLIVFKEDGRGGASGIVVIVEEVEMVDALAATLAVLWRMFVT